MIGTNDYLNRFIAIYPPLENLCHLRGGSHILYIGEDSVKARIASDSLAYARAHIVYDATACRTRIAPGTYEPTEPTEPTA